MNPIPGFVSEAFGESAGWKGWIAEGKPDNYRPFIRQGA